MLRKNLSIKLSLLTISFVIMVSLAYADEQWDGRDNFNDPIWRFGKVGIGVTSTPTEQLEVLGGIKVKDYLKAWDNGGLFFKTDEGTVRLRIADNGNIGIGMPGEPPAEPEHKLDIFGGIRLGDYIRAKDNNGLKLQTDEGTTRLTIADDGNVGIGTTDPGAKLDVVVSSGGAATIGSSINTATGDYAIAMGHQTEASGHYSTAMGWNTTASGHSSTSMGMNTTASGHYSTAMGTSTTASGIFSTAMGSFIETTGDRSFGIGLDTTARTITMDNVMAIMGGNVGIGTTEPSQKLTVHNGRIRVESSTYPSAQIELVNLNTNRNFTMITVGDNFEIHNGDESETLTKPFMIDGSTDFIGIGTLNPQSKLAVNGIITAKEIEVTDTGWSDFVFNSNYDLKSLDEVDQFISKNGHLPDIPSAEEVEKNGLNLGTMQAKLLQKIEELTLYLIDMQKENENLKERISSLETTK